MNLKILSDTTKRNRLEWHHCYYFFPRFESMDFLLVSFLFDFGFGFYFPFFWFVLTFFFFFSFIFPFEFCINIMSLKYDQIGDPKRPFSHFLKYGENEEIDIFSIDNTIVLKKKRSQFFFFTVCSKWVWVQKLLQKFENIES